MNSKYEKLPNKTRDLIKELEKQHGIELSTIQKILCSINGPIVTTLDVLYGDVGLFVIDQHIEKADEDVAEKLNINVGDEVDKREIIAHKYGRPLTYGLSFIPKERCSSTVIEKLLKEKETTGRILLEREIETITKVEKISIAEPTPEIQNMFHTSEKMLEREYIVIHKKNVVIWSKEAYPLNYFKE